MPNDSISSSIQKRLASMEWKCLGYLALAFNFHRLAVPTLALVIMAACSGKTEKPGEQKIATEQTTATAEVAQADSDLEFFTERYLSPDERLSRRQSRIEAVLAAP